MFIKLHYWFSDVFYLWAQDNWPVYSFTEKKKRIHKWIYIKITPIKDATVLPILKEPQNIFDIDFISNFIVVQLLSCVQLCNPTDGSMPDFPILYSLPVCSNSQSIKSGYYLTISILCSSLLLLSSIFPSIMVFFSESALHIRWPKS